MATIILGSKTNHLKLEGMIEGQPFVANVTYNNGATWPAEPSLKFANGEVWLPAVDGDVRVWNIPSTAVDRVLALDSHLAEFYIGTRLHSRSLDAF